MGIPSPHSPVLLLSAAFSRHAAALEWARKQLEQAWGPVALASEPFPFVETAFYEPDMGTGLVKQFWAFERLVDPARLPEFKLQTNGWEEDYQRQAGHAEPRPLNLDPGYLTQAKLVLATTKDRDHRLYLGQGIFGEVTLRYHHGRWQEREWTYPDYRRPEYHLFFEACRAYLRGQRPAPASLPPWA